MLFTLVALVAAAAAGPPPPAAGPYPQCSKALSPGCTAAKAKLVTLPYILVSAKVQGDIQTVQAAADGATQCKNSMHACSTMPAGAPGRCCAIAFDWSNYTSTLALLTSKGDEASGAGGKACFLDEVVVSEIGAQAFQTNSTHQLPAYFPAACLNAQDMGAFASEQSCVCKAATKLAYCGQAYAC